MERFKFFVKGFFMMLIIASVIITGIQSIIYNPYAFFKVLGIITIAYGSWKMIEFFKSYK